MRANFIVGLLFGANNFCWCKVACGKWTVSVLSCSCSSSDSIIVTVCRLCTWSSKNIRFLFNIFSKDNALTSFTYMFFYWSCIFHHFFMSIVNINTPSINNFILFSTNLFICRLLALGFVQNCFVQFPNVTFNYDQNCTNRESIYLRNSYERVCISTNWRNVKKNGIRITSKFQELDV